jgi:hypothetical protein
MSESNGHITKLDLLDMEGRLHSALRRDMDKLESRVRRDIEGVETRLLTEFWKWGRASE